jgi:hypothetical protein
MESQRDMKLPKEKVDERKQEGQNSLWRYKCNEP